MARIAMSVLWPAFLMAGVLEGLIFVVVDPSELHWFDGPALGWSDQAVYTVTFLMLWGVLSLSGALTALLLRSADEVNSRRHVPF
ncbi:hypothetical protein ABXN37_00770 [Piscinibacter sakaiensis]|uniref:Putative transmembrane protein n=1 Tax=Piscinibacter sakaiensis TaxID=1547922 RepID=A0A0K8NTM0_PISS1|nr:hypothetical protein [Piscinibacter sakaiensis]GAP33698.1 putative transmembrane protein [Piscinibacter sakaiensis]